jgi:Domain of unknown function (DUF4158)
MPRRELLAEPQRLIFNAPASDERGMVRYYTLSADDIALINRHPGDSNRLGFAVMLCYLVTCDFQDGSSNRASNHRGTVYFCR